MVGFGAFIPRNFSITASPIVRGITPFGLFQSDFETLSIDEAKILSFSQEFSVIFNLRIQIQSLLSLGFKYIVFNIKSMEGPSSSSVVAAETSGHLAELLVGKNLRFLNPFSLQAWDKMNNEFYLWGYVWPSKRSSMRLVFGRPNSTLDIRSFDYQTRAS